MAIPWATKAQNTLTICDGTATNNYVPFYGYYADVAQNGQMIYPADSLTDMIGMQINQMVFYISSTGYGNGTFELRTSIGGEVLGTMTVHNCNIFTRFETAASIPDGKTAIYLTYTGGGTINLQSFGFVH